jgi:hypothetical protein
LELEAFDKIFDGNLTASNVECALHGQWKGLIEAAAKAQGHLLGRTAASVFVVFHLYNIKTKGILLE